MTRYTLYVPVRLKSGMTVPNIWVRQFEHDLADTFGGFTRIEAMGGWRPPIGETILEPMRLYAIDTDDSFAPKLLEGLAHKVKRELEQDTVYLTWEAIERKMI